MPIKLSVHSTDIKLVVMMLRKKKRLVIHESLPLLFLTSMNPCCLILSRKSLPKRPSMPLFKSKRPEILTIILTSLYVEAYKSTAFPPAKIDFSCIGAFKVLKTDESLFFEAIMKINKNCCKREILKAAKINGTSKKMIGFLVLD